MLTIRAEQMEALKSAARQNALDRLAAHLRSACPAQASAMTDEDLRHEIEAGVVHAGRYGIEGEDDLGIFLECRLELGADFDARADTAWAGAILRDDTLFPEDKASALSDRHMFAAGSRSGLRPQTPGPAGPPGEEAP